MLSWSAAKVAAQNNDGKIESIQGKVVMLVLTDWFTSFPRTSSDYNRLEGDNENLLMKVEKWFLSDIESTVRSGEWWEARPGCL